MQIFVHTLCGVSFLDSQYPCQQSSTVRIIDYFCHKIGWFSTIFRVAIDSKPAVNRLVPIFLSTRFTYEKSQKIFEN